MLDPRKDGLLKFAGIFQRTQLESDLRESFENLFITLRNLRADAQEVEGLVSRALFGEASKGICADDLDW